MIYHVVPLDEWVADSDRPYSPASLSNDGFVHCSPDEETTFAVASAFYREVPGPLMALVIDEHRLDAPVRWEAADSAPPSAVAAGTLFPHVFGRVNRDAVQGVMEIQRDDEGRATALAAWQ